MRDAIVELESWKDQEKGRYVNDISIGTNYGACCWGITLGNVDIPINHNWFNQDDAKGAEVHGAECAFFELEEIPINFAYPPKQEGKSWPGLAATILAALDKAKELGI